MQPMDPNQPSFQGSTSITDVVTTLQGVTKQIQAGNTQLALIVSALLGVNLKSYTVATLPSGPAIGNMAVVTDGTSGLAWGAAVTGGHSTTYVVWWNGAQWSVMGK